MARIELLDNITHKDLRVAPGFASELGDNIASTLTFITEFAEVQKEYPILFRKDPVSGGYQSVVLFGLQKDENLFLVEQDPSRQKHLGWDAAYVPAAVARGPFSIGLQRQAEQGNEQVVPVVHVEMEHPKVITSDASAGIPVFLEQGGNSPYLNYIASMLNLIRDGMQIEQAMFAAFVRHELLEDVTINVELDNHDKFRVENFQTINADKLLALSGEALAELNRAGFLQAAFFVVASLANMKRLIDRKNRQLRAS